MFGLILSGRFDNSTSVDLNSAHVLRIHTETMSENIFTDELDSCIKHVFPSHQESKKLDNNKPYIDFKDNLSVTTQQNCNSKSFTTSYLTIINDQKIQLLKKTFKEWQSTFR